MRSENKKVRDQRDGYRKQRDVLRKELGKDTEGEADETKKLWGVAWWWWPVWGAILVALIGGAVFTSISAQKDDPRYSDPDSALPVEEMDFQDTEEPAEPEDSGPTE